MYKEDRKILNKRQGSQCSQLRLYHFTECCVRDGTSTCKETDVFIQRKHKKVVSIEKKPLFFRQSRRLSLFSFLKIISSAK